MKEFLIYGMGDFADIVFDCITNSMHRRVAGFVLDDEFITKPFHHELPVISINTVESQFPPQKYSMAVGFIGKQMFVQRQKKFKLVEAKGFEMENVIHSSVQQTNCKIGRGNIILENVSIGPFVHIGSGNIFWQKVVLPHHNIVGNFNHFAPSVSLSGYSKVNNNAFLGNQSILNNRVTIADYTFVGAGAYVAKDTKPYDVIVPARSVVLCNHKSTDFL